MTETEQKTGQRSRFLEGARRQEAIEECRKRLKEVPEYSLSHIVSAMGYVEAERPEGGVFDALVNPGLQFYGGFATGLSLASKEPELAKRYLEALRADTGFEDGGGTDDILSDELIDCASIMDEAREALKVKTKAKAKARTPSL